MGFRIFKAGEIRFQNAVATLVRLAVMSNYVAWFGDKEEKNSLALVGGKNYSLSKLYSLCEVRSDMSFLRVPNGFALTTSAYRHFIGDKVQGELRKVLSKLDDKTDIGTLHEVSEACREIVYKCTKPGHNDNNDVWDAVIQSYHDLCCEYENYPSDSLSVAVRSSATAEDLPNASFAGQHDSFLNISGDVALIEACRRCMASIFTSRAIVYRVENKFDHFAVALSVGIMKMIRADVGVSGVMFTCETENGHCDFVEIESVYGLGENIVQGRVQPDQYLLHKPTFNAGYRKVLKRTLGSKIWTMKYSPTSSSSSSADDGGEERKSGDKREGAMEPRQPPQQQDHQDYHYVDYEAEDSPAQLHIDTITNVPTPLEQQQRFTLTSDEVLLLTDDALEIESIYACTMDIEFAKDGLDNQIYVLQARPETVSSGRRDLVASGRAMEHEIDNAASSQARLLSNVGMAIGDKVATGTIRLIRDSSDHQAMSRCQPGEVIVTPMTSPDMVPLMKIAAAIVTEQGARTCHAAIVTRELGVPCIVGAEGIINTLTALEQQHSDGDGESHRAPPEVTVSCCEGEHGKVYLGAVPFTSKCVGSVSELRGAMPSPLMVRLNLGDPSLAFRAAMMSCGGGVGLVRMEFIVANSVCVHPMALIEAASSPSSSSTSSSSCLTPCEAAFIRERCRLFRNPTDYFVRTLAENLGIIAAAFWPAPVNIRFSDFKSNEYAQLIAASAFEQEDEDNPLLGFRGACRYVDPRYEAAFRLEVRAVRYLRESLGLTNIQVLVPFCRSVAEAKRVMKMLSEEGLPVKGAMTASASSSVGGECGPEGSDDRLTVNMMLELPGNVMMMEELMEVFDGFSIGSNDMAMLCLGVDRDSASLGQLYAGVEGGEGMLDESTTRMITMAIDRARAGGAPIGLCGEAATDPQLVQRLLGHGVNYLSVNPSSAVQVMRLVGDFVNDCQNKDIVRRLYPNSSTTSS